MPIRQQQLYDSGTEIEIIRSLEGFENLRGEWSDLITRSYTNSIFLTWEWLYAWWLAYSSDKHLYLLCLRDNNGQLIGIAPLFHHTIKYYGIPVKELTVLGGKMSDRQDFIVDKNHPEVYKAFLIYVNRSKDWHIFRIEQVPDWSPLISRDNIFLSRRIEQSAVLPYLEINDPWESYLRSLSRNSRRNLTKDYNKLNKEGNWKFEMITNPDIVENELEKIFEIETASRKSQQGYALFQDPRARDFQRNFSMLCKKTGWLCISYLILNDAPISYLLGFSYNHCYFAYNIAHLPAYDRLSPGTIICNETIKHAFKHQLKEIDMLRGASYLKRFWTKNGRKNYRIVFFGCSMRSHLLRLAVFTVRPMLKRYFFKTNHSE